MSNLSILRAGETGKGYLIEYDAGFISPADKRNLPFVNEMKKFEQGSNIITEPYYVYAVLQKYGVKNRNGRVYPEDILKSQGIAYQALIDDRGAIGELDHPAESIIAGDRVSHNIVEMWWEGNVMMGKIEILMSPGFINMGIVSTMGDQVANLLRHRIKIGVSSRGVGSVEDVNGIQVVQNDFELICWDIVTNPSTPGSWIFHDMKDSKPMKMEVVESKSKIISGLDKFLLG
tara:strand:- start:816 stop:1511 length:696 start_codon:yes stop_codon:yes gene_type:complete